MTSGVAARPQPSRFVVDVGVEDNAGKPETRLTRDDFEILVDSVPRPIETFSAEGQPLALAMLVDASVSMSTVKLPDDERYRETLESFIRELETGDRAALARVAGRAAMIPTFRDNTDALFRDVSNVLAAPDIDRLGPSPLWDAIVAATDRLSAEPGSRAVLLWTDGRTTGNYHGLADATDRAIVGAVSVHLVIEYLPRRAQDNKRQNNEPNPCARFGSITRATGGTCRVNFTIGDDRVPFIKESRRALDSLQQRYTLERPGEAIRDMLRSLHQRYSLGFQGIQPDDEMHALEIRVKRPGFRVRAPTRFRAAK
jgi:hypothetical protein